ncbi:MAG: hypothetical protein QOJ79_2588 [Actinomycetota bacterium]|jgi:hypothetical protein|nr:hypothetical protein [Actinomycetota bacterium]
MARRSAPLVTAVAALLIAGGATAAFSATTAPPAATFTKPMLLAGGGAEPSIRVPKDGLSAAYVSAPTGLGSNFWRITERKNPDGSSALIQGPVMQPDLGTGGGDSEISVGNARYAEGSPCDAISYSGLHNIDLLDNFTVARSIDCGKSFELLNPYGTQNTLTDRQWQAFDGSHTNFLIFHKVDTSQIVVTESPDAGNTYVSLAPDGAHGIIDPATMPSVVNQNQVGNIVTDYSHPTGTNNLLSSEPTHVMYATFGGPRDPADNAQAQIDSNAPGTNYNHQDTIYVAKSSDGGVTWTDTMVYSTPAGSKRELNLLFPVVEVDKAGNVYSLWSDGYKIEYAVSTDGAKTWSKPFQINTDNRGAKPDEGRSDLFPWMAAGANGTVDVVWYHGEGGAKGSNLIYRNQGDRLTNWTVAFAQLGKATAKSSTGAAAPTMLTYTNYATPVMHHGSICNNGTFCDLPIPGSSGDRSLLDFFQVAIDGAGRANIALADNEASPGSNISAYVRQTSGYSVTSGQRMTPERISPPRLVCTADAAFTDPSGDATDFQVAAPLPNAPALDIVKGYVTYDAAKKSVVFHTKMLDLSQDPPAGATGEFVEFSFAYGGQTYQAVGVHDATQPQDDYHLEQLKTTGRTQIGAALTGAFDKKASEVRVNVPVDFLSKLKLAPVMATGSKLTGLTVGSRRDEAATVLPAADLAGSLGCPFVLGAKAATGATPTTVPSKVDARPAPGRLPATGLGLGLPLLAAGVLLLALGLRRSVRD